MSITSKLLRHALWTSAIMAVLLGPAFTATTVAQGGKQRPTFKQIGGIVAAKVKERDGYQAGDLLHQKDVKRVLRALAGAGWSPADSKKIRADTLPENATLVRVLSTRRGIKFMRKVNEYELIFDRMDRICSVPGGQRMLADIAKLPDGEKLAKLKRRHGVPGFLDLLPKNSSGKVRTIKDYKQPTGRIYTETQLLERLELSYQGQTSAATRKP